MGLDPDAEGARQQYLQEFKSFEWLQKKGPRVCGSRWGTWAEAHEFRRGFHRSRLLLLTALWSAVRPEAP